MAARAAIYQAMIALGDLAPDRARACALEALEQLDESSNLRAEAKAVLARARVMLGEHDGAIADAREAHELAATQSRVTGHALVHLALVEAYAEAGRTDEARAVLAEAQAVLARGARGAPESVRDDYFARVPTHLALREWADRLDAHPER